MFKSKSRTSFKITVVHSNTAISIVGLLVSFLNRDLHRYSSFDHAFN